MPNNDAGLAVATVLGIAAGVPIAANLIGARRERNRQWRGALRQTITNGRKTIDAVPPKTLLDLFNKALATGAFSDNRALDFPLFPSTADWIPTFAGSTADDRNPSNPSSH